MISYQATAYLLSRRFAEVSSRQSAHGSRLRCITCHRRNLASRLLRVATLTPARPIAAQASGWTFPSRTLRLAARA